MAKKTNRPKSKSTARPAAKQAAIEKASPPPAEALTETPVVTPPGPPRALRPVKQSRSQIAAEQLEEQYSFITGDLRRVFILAAAMFTLLIVANLVFGLVTR